MKLYGVVGANYGDEGKGMVSANIRHHAGPTRTVTVLTNGGAQRGHTVDAPDGRRFVFHHMGASLPGDANVTYCPRQFVVNPMVLMQDLRDIEGWAIGPSLVFMHPECMVTTPYDMMADQVSELSLGDSRWGSTGMGVWHTKHRSRFVDLRVGELAELVKSGDLQEATRRIGNVRDYWLKNACGTTHIPTEYSELFNMQALMDRWLDDAVEAFTSHVVIGDPRDFGKYDSFVFENAQGLELSQERGQHCTSSVTGALAITEIVKDMKLGSPKSVRMNYVTRSYTTRHGVGFMLNECPQELLHTEMVDRTNVWNQWQGTLRYGLLEQAGLATKLQLDVEQAGMSRGNARLIVTHVNEVPFRDKGFDLPPVTEVDNPYMTEDYGIV